MGESKTIDVSAAKAVAFIGAIVMIVEGLWYIPNAGGYVLFIITGIVMIAGGVILLLVVEVGFTVHIGIPYASWLLLVIGGGVLALEIITSIVVGTGLGTRLLNVPSYLGALLVLTAAFLELDLQGKFKMTASKFVTLVGAIIILFLSITTFGGGLWFIVGIAVGVLLLLMVFDVLPYAWWLLVILIIAVIPAFYYVHQTLLIPWFLQYEGVSVVLVGLLLMITDK